MDGPILRRHSRLDTSAALTGRCSAYATSFIGTRRAQIVDFTLSVHQIYKIMAFRVTAALRAVFWNIILIDDIFGDAELGKRLPPDASRIWPASPPKGHSLCHYSLLAIYFFLQEGARSWWRLIRVSLPLRFHFAATGTSPPRYARVLILHFRCSRRFQCALAFTRSACLSPCGARQFLENLIIGFRYIQLYRRLLHYFTQQP